jgi:hypothetical protein
LDRYIELARDFESANGQTRRLAAMGKGFAGPVTPMMLDVAKERLAGFSAVGTTERFDDSMVAFARAFGWRRMRYEWANRTVARQQREEVSPDLIARLEDDNEHDRELHRFAGRCLDERLDAIDVARELRRLHRGDRYARSTAKMRVGLSRAKRAGINAVKPRRSEG